MHNSPTINVLNQIVRKTSKVLLRDYFELENLQSSHHGPSSYATKSYSIVQEMLCNELTRSYPDYSIAIDENNYLYTGNSEFRFTINPLDDYQNFSRTNFSFASSIVLEKMVKDKFETMTSLINAPFLGLTYFANKGQGAWLERVERSTTNSYRMRVSSNNVLKSSLLGLNKFIFADSPIQNLRQKIEEITPEIRIYGSELLSGALVASGKLDIAIFYKPSFNNILAIKLLINEAGGITFYAKDMQKDVLIACNSAHYKELFKYFSN